MGASGTHHPVKALASLGLLPVLLLAVVTPAPAQPICGDCDGDLAPQVSILDALSAARIAAQLNTPTASQECYCDCNSDGGINILDALAMAQVAAQLPVVLTCTGNACSADELTYVTASVAADLPSTADTLPEAVAAWELTFTDAGGDGADSTLTDLVFRADGANQVADWSAALGGAELRSGAGVLAAGTVTADTITCSGFSHVIAEGTTSPVTLHLFLDGAPDALDGLDNLSFVLSLAPADVTLAAPGSRVSAGQATVATAPGDLAITVEATELHYTTQPTTPVNVNASMGPVALEATDVNSNLDADFAQATTLSRLGGAGTLASTDPGGLIRSFSGGTVTWSNLTCDTPTTMQVRATAMPSGLTVDSASVTVEAFSAPEVTYASGAALPAVASTVDTPGEQVAAWSVLFQDAGLDGSPATVEGLVLRPGAGNQIATWSTALGGVELRAGAVVLASGTVAAGTVTFVGFSRVIPNGGSDTLTVHAYLSAVPDALDGLDNQRFVLSLAPADVTLNVTGSVLSGGQTAQTSGAGNLALTITATELHYTTQPTTPVNVNASMGPVALEATDVNSNLDADFAQSTTLSRLGGAGTLASTDPGGVTRSFSGGTVSWSNLTCDTPTTMQVRATATPSGLTVDSASVTVEAYSAPELTYSSGATAATLPSTADTFAERVAAWSLPFVDAGVDGSPATVEGLVLRAGANNQVADWASALGGAELRSGAGSLATGSIAASTLTFSGFSRVIPNGGSDTLTVYLYLSAVPDALDGLDNRQLVFDLAPADVTVNPSGSVLSGGQTTQSTVGGNNVITVTASQLRYTTQPTTPVFAGANMGPVALEATDDRSNLDEDFAEAVTLSRLGGAGNLASTDPGGLTRSFAAGIGSWSNLTCDTGTVMQVRATGTPSGVMGDSIAVTVVGIPTITAVVPDRGPAEGGNWVQIQGSSFLAGQAVTLGGDPVTDLQVLSTSLITGRVPRASAAEAGGPAVTVTVGGGSLAAAYSYLADATGPAVVETVPESFSGAIADTQRIAFQFDSTIDPATVQDPTASVTTSTALAQVGGSFLAGSAHASEDERWVVVRRASGTWTGGGGQVQGFVFGDVVGASAIQDPFGNGIITYSGTLGGRAVEGYFSDSPVSTYTDAIAPTVVRTVPAAGATGVPTRARVQIHFSEEMDPTTLRQAAGGPVTAATFQIWDTVAGAAVPGRLEVGTDLRRLVWYPDDGLAPGTLHEIRLTNGGATARPEDLAGVGLAGATVSFSTGASAGLAVLACDPPEGEITGGYSVRVLGEFFAPGATVTVDGVPATGVVRRSGSELEIWMPAGSSTGAKDVVVTNPGGAAATGTGAFTYTTSRPQDLLRPELLFEYPLSAAGGGNPCASNSKLVVVISEPLSTAAVAFTEGTTEAFQVSGDTGTASLQQLATDPRIVVVTPGSTFSSAPRLHLVVERMASRDRGVQDRAGNRIFPWHPDRTFSGIGTDPSLGLAWTLAGADGTSPSYASREPAPASSSNASGAPITITLDEEVNPATVENPAKFAVTDGAGVVPGTLSFQVDTLRAWTFTPGRAYVGTVTVDARNVEDLAGNTIGGAVYTFTAGGDSQAPTLDLVTLNDIPSYLNGDPANGGGSPAGGRLRVPPTGFTIDLYYSDAGGQVSALQSSFTLTSSTAVAGYGAGTNLAPYFPAGHFQADTGHATFLVPPGLPFPAGTSDATAVVSTLTCTVRDEAGNASAPVTFTFDCVEPLGRHVALDAGPDVWYLLFGRDHETTTFSFATYDVPAPGADGCPGGDGQADFEDDLQGYGLLSFAPFAPNGTALVDSGGMDINTAARNWVINRILYHMYRMYGLSVDWADGNPNPGFAAIRSFDPAGSLEGASLRFEYSAGSPGSSTNRMAFGGYTSPTVLGRAAFDSRNRNRANDDGEACFGSNRGTFTTLRLTFEYDTTPSSFTATFRQIFDRVTPFVGAVTPNPIGNDPEDPYVLDPAQDPSTFVGARQQRYLDVVNALEGFAMSTVATAAHEVGHSLGLVEDGDPGLGLYGGDAAFPGSTSGHVNLGSYFPANGENLMAAGSSMDQDLSRFSLIDELNQAYLQNRALVVP